MTLVYKIFQTNIEERNCLTLNDFQENCSSSKGLSYPFNMLHFGRLVMPVLPREARLSLEKQNAGIGRVKSIADCLLKSIGKIGRFLTISHIT